MSSPFGSLQVSLVWGPAGNEVDPDYATCLRYLADHDVLDINMARCACVVCLQGPPAAW